MARMTGRSNQRAALCVLLAASATAGAQAPQPAGPVMVESAPGLAPQPAATLEQLIADLASQDFHARELATVRIRDDKAIRLADIERILSTAQLPLEAHSRLLTIARDRFISSPRAAMGVQFDLMTLRDRIVIEDTFPPFACHKLLEPGDIVIEADGIPLTGSAGRPLIQGMIISRDPGDTMKLVVRRGKEKLTFDVKLGDFRELRNNTLDEARLYRAWRTRSRTYTRAEMPIKTPVHPDAWPDALEASRMRQMQQIKVQPSSPSIVVHAGGRARSSNLINDSSWYSAQLRGVNGGRVNAMGANAQALQLFLDFDDPNPQPRMTFAEEVDSLGKKRTALEGQLSRDRREAGRAQAGTAEAAILEARVVRSELGLRAVDRQLEAINAEKAEQDEAAARKRTAAASADEPK